MPSRRVGGFRLVARAGAIGSIALIGMALSANATFAATAIGSAVGTVPCSAGFSLVQISSSSAGYAVPAGGVSISSWSTQAIGNTGPVGLQVWRPAGTAQTYTLVGASPLVTVAAGALNSFTLTTKIPVKAGDLIGLRVEGKAACFLYTSSTTDIYGSAMGLNPTTGSNVLLAPHTGYQLDVAAAVDLAVVVAPPPPVAAPPPPVAAPPPPVTTPPPSGDPRGQRVGEDYQSSGCSSSASFGANSTGKSDWDEGDKEGRFSRHRNHNHNCND